MGVILRSHCGCCRCQSNSRVPLVCVVYCSTGHHASAKLGVCVCARVHVCTPYGCQCKRTWWSSLKLESSMCKRYVSCLHVAYGYCEVLCVDSGKVRGSGWLGSRPECREVCHTLQSSTVTLSLISNAWSTCFERTCSFMSKWTCLNWLKRTDERIRVQFKFNE